jgi:hypothetical protein
MSQMSQMFQMSSNQNQTFVVNSEIQSRGRSRQRDVVVQNRSNTPSTSWTIHRRSNTPSTSWT